MSEGNFEMPQQENISIRGQEFEVDKNGFVEFGEICEMLLNKQTQYGSRYIDGKIDGYPNLGDGLRFEGDTDDYHFIKIHKDDVEEFLKRYEEHSGN